MRERVESRRARQNYDISSLFEGRSTGARRAPHNPQAACMARKVAAPGGPGWERETSWRPKILTRPVGPARPARSDHQQRVARHFNHLGQPRDNPLGGTLGGLLDNPALRAWLPRVLALLLVCSLGLGIWLYGCSVGEARAAAAAPAETPTPTPKPKAKPGAKTTILVLGSDSRPDDGSFRTDVLILLTIDPAKNTVSALSLPRDLIAKVPGYGDERINLVMQMGGFKLMQDTLEQSYGARPEYYFMTNFAGFTGLINSIGGIDVYAAQPLTDACDLYWSRAGTCEIKKGKVSMDGNTALWYIRSRHSTSDFDRMRRAQEVMLGIFNRFMKMNAIKRLPALYKQYKEDVETNMPANKLLPLLPVAAHVAQHPSQIKRFEIPESATTDWFMWNGARVLLPDYEAIKKIVVEAGAAK
jgi:LCP family protein required for cell wall assembly